MKTIDWNAIVKDVEAQVIALAEEILKGYVGQAKLDAANFLQNSKVSLQKWATMLATGMIDKDEFQSLVKGQLDVAELHALKQAGLAKIRIDQFVSGVVRILTSVVMSAAKSLL